MSVWVKKLSEEEGTPREVPGEDQQQQPEATTWDAATSAAKQEDSVVQEQFSDDWQQGWEGWHEAGGGWQDGWGGWQAGWEDGSKWRKHWEQRWDELWKTSWKRAEQAEDEGPYEGGADAADHPEGQVEGGAGDADHPESLVEGGAGDADHLEGLVEGGSGDADHAEGAAKEEADATTCVEDSLNNEQMNALAAELKAALPEGLQCTASDREFDFAQWKGAAMLEMEMRLFVADLQEGSRPTDAIRFASAAVQHASLSRLHQALQLPVHRAESRKCRSEYVQAMVWELKELGSRTVCEMILRELVGITRSQVCAYPEEAKEIMTNWIKTFEADWGYPYTHSSFRGEKDWCTSTGRLDVTNTRDLDRLYSFIAHFHRLAKPLCFVEMYTAHHYLCEDIDVRGRDDFLLPGKDMSFWQRRATMLQQMFPDVEPIRLTLFTASGWDVAHGEYKSSFHALWNVVVDQERHAVVRSETIRELSKKSGKGWCETLAKSMLKANPANTWEAVFDASTVVGGSVRLPLCDKIRKEGARQIPENRVLLPSGVWEFHKAQDSQAVSVLRPNGATDEEWVKLGSVRQTDDDGNMLSLSRFVPPDDTCPAEVMRFARKAAHSFGGSVADYRTRQESKLQREKQAWYDGQRECRRVFQHDCQYIDAGPTKSCASAFKRLLDVHMGDPDGAASSLSPLSAKDGTERWLWSAKYLKGAVELTIPVDQSSAKILVRGSKEQQRKFVEVLKQFTDPWEGDLPAFKKPTR